MTRFQKDWETWSKSPEGRTAHDVSIRIRSEIQENRLFAAYTAGFISGDKERRSRERKKK